MHHSPKTTEEYLALKGLTPGVMKVPQSTQKEVRELIIQALWDSGQFPRNGYPPEEITNVLYNRMINFLERFYET
jgi:hypothetical protein